MAEGSQTEAIRAFVRHFNVVIKQVNLYGLAHRQVAPQLENTWKELESALRQDKVVLTAAGDHLLFNGKPLQAGSADRNLAQTLVAAGIAGICFLPGLNKELLGELVQIMATSKAPELQAAFKNHFAPKAPVRLLEFHMGGEERPAGGLGITGVLASAMLSNLNGVVAKASGKPASTNDLLRLLCSIEQKGGSAGDSAGSSDENPQLAEDDVTQTIRWLAKLSAGSNSGDDSAGPMPQELSAAGLSALRGALQANAEQSTEDEATRPALLSLAEQLAVKLALEKYQRGEIPFNAVQELLQRLKKEIETLHSVLQSHEETMQHAGLTPETASEALDRQFWVAIPARNKLQVLLSEEAWCIPPKNAKTFVEELLESSSPEAEPILRNYCVQLKNADPAARLRVASGLAVLAPCYSRCGVKLTRWAMGIVSSTLSHELSSDLTAPLCTALASLVQGAANAQKYEIVPAFFDKLQDLQGLAPQISERVHIEAGIEACAGRYLDDALQSEIPANDLIEALQQMPYAVASELKKRAAGCAKRDDYRRLTDLAGHLGDPLLDALRQSAAIDQPMEALPAIGLLTPVDGRYVEQTLKKRLKTWSPMQQAVAIHQISSSGMADRGVILSELFDSFNELILPQAIDEIGLSGTAKLDRLIHEVGKKETSSPYIQLKTIEALGNLKAKAAVPLLKEIVLARSVWKWEFERETRIVALQALLKIDPPTAKNVMKSSGISSEELALAQLRPSAGNWIRQRRYARIPIEGEMWASITSDSGSCDVSLEALSLGGGGGTPSMRAPLGSAGEVELKIGLRKVRAKVLVHSADSHKIGFEIASIPLEDRMRLRQFLTAKRPRFA